MRLVIPLAVLLLAAAGCSSPGRAATPTPTPTPRASQPTGNGPGAPVLTAVPTPVPLPAGEGGFRCGAQSGGDTAVSGPLDLITAVRIGRGDGFDRFVLEYAGGGPVPAFEVTPRSSA